MKDKNIITEDFRFEMIYSPSSTRSLKSIEIKQLGKKKRILYKSEYVKNLFKDQLINIEDREDKDRGENAVE